MEKMTDLQDLLKHEIKDLYSAEEQIIQAMPRMIEKVSNPQLRQALEMHLRITEGQLQRLQQVQQLMAQGGGQEEGNEQGGNGLFARLMRRRSQGTETGTGGEKCLGMEGLLKEGEKVMGEEMEPSVLDAAIIACAQKIEHYEICGYGTARAYARELNMGEVAELLEQTLDEEYEADDRLTDLAVGRLNEEAEMGGARRGSRSSASSAAGRSSSRSAATKSTSRSRAGAAVAASGSRGGSSSSSGRGSSGSNRGNASSSRGNASSSRGSSSTRSASSSGRSAGRSKTATKSSSSRGGSAAPASKTSSTRSTSKSSGRSSGSSNTRSAAGSRSGKAPSKAAAAKGGRNSSGGGRTASKSTGRGGSSSGRSAGRR